MVVRKRRKKNKLRGNRFHGKGNTKNKRGAGSRGGRGRAGSHKHKFSKYWNTFGIKRRLKAGRKLKAVNLNDLGNRLQELIESKKVVERQGKLVLDCKKAGIEKILGKGRIAIALIVVNCKASKRAIAKIEKAGGKVEAIEKAGKESSKKGRKVIEGIETIGEVVE